MNQMKMELMYIAIRNRNQIKLTEEIETWQILGQSKLLQLKLQISEES